MPLADQVHRNKKASSFNHLVGALLELHWHVEAERPSGLEIDHQLELDGLLDGQVGGLGALENLDDVPG